MTCSRGKCCGRNSHQGLCSSTYPETPLGEPRPDRNSPGERVPGTATLAQQPLHRSPLSSRIKGDPQLPSHSGPSEPLLILIPSLALLAAPSTPLPQALGAAAVTSASPALGPALGRAQQLCPSPAGWLGGRGWKGRVGMVPREPSALPGAWPPAQTLASPPGAALGPLSPCQGAPGGPSSPPRLGHQPSSAICLLPEPERSLQGTLEHECPLKNEQVLGVSSRGQRPEARAGCAERCPPSPSLVKPRAGNPLGDEGLHPLTSAQLAGAAGRGQAPSPTAPAQVTKGGKAS